MSIRKRALYRRYFHQAQHQALFPRPAGAVLPRHYLPLIFLFVFGSFNSGNNNVNFKVALLNDSDTAFSKQFVQQLESDKSSFKVRAASIP